MFLTLSKKCVSITHVFLVVQVGIQIKILVQMKVGPARLAHRVTLIRNTLKAETKNHSFLSKNRISIRIRPRCKSKYNRSHCVQIEIHTKMITRLEKRGKCRGLIKVQWLMAVNMNRTMMLSNLIVKVLTKHLTKKLNNQTIR